MKRATGTWLAFALASQLAGCSYALKPAYPARTVSIRVAEAGSPEVALRVGKRGAVRRADSNGIVELELPAIERRCDVYLWFIPIDKQHVPEVFVLRAGRVVDRIGLATLHNLSTESTMPLPTR